LPRLLSRGLECLFQPALAKFIKSNVAKASEENYSQRLKATAIDVMTLANVQ
jgi:hypothetical protein